MIPRRALVLPSLSAAPTTPLSSPAPCLQASSRGPSPRTSRRGLAATLAGVCALLGLLAALSLPARAQAPNWVQNSPTTSPSSPGSGYSMVDEAALGQAFLIDGAGYTWLWNGVNWTQQFPTSSPSARLYSQMDYDSVNQQVVLFGGCGDCAGNTSILGDTWLWTGANWVNQTGLTMTPPARSDAAMAYNPVHQQSVLFGGEDNANEFADTWLWNGTNWTQVSPSPAPPARYGHVMAYLPTPNLSTPGQVVLFGGTDMENDFFRDTWLWDGSTWTQPTLATNPPARLRATMAYDAALGQLVLFGGYDANNFTYLNDTWLWNGTNWTQANPGAYPSARDLSSMAYDAAIGQMVLFGGNGVYGVLTDTWSYEAPTTITVTSAADDGSAGTLRTLIAAAAPGDTITFAPSLNGQTITLDCSDPGFGTIILAQNVTIAGPGANNLAISGNNECQIFQVNSGVTATISGLTIENGSAAGDQNSPAGQGGGIYNAGTLTINNCAFANNFGEYGGAIAYQGGALTVSGSVFSGNTANGGGGAIYAGFGNPTTTVINSTFSGNSAQYGGGIANLSGSLAVSFSTFAGNYTSMEGSGGGIYNNTGATLTVSNSTFSSNRASFEGGGIYNNTGGTLTVSNSTFAGNYAYEGGGIFNQTALTVSNSTFSGNSASGGGGGGIAAPSGTLTLKGVLLAGQTAGGNCFIYGSTPTSAGYNLSDDSSCTFLTATGDLNGVSANLGPLQNNGGPTQTFALLSSSPAIDAIPPNNCTDAFGNLVTDDQRGIPRPQGKGCDIGAFEVQSGYTPNLVANVCPSGATTPAPCSVTFSLQFTVPSGTTLASTPVQVVTQGATGLDFNPISGGGTTTCTSGLQGPATCTVQATFASIAPGVRQGAISLTDSNGNLVARTLLTGLGQAPQLVFPGGPEVTVNSGFYPGGVATDAAGNIYVSAVNVIVIPAGCSNSSCYKQWGSGWYAPFELAVDGAGNVYVPDDFSSTYIVPPGCTSTSCETTVGSVSGPGVVALDGAGDVYIGSLFYHGPLYEVLAGGGQTTVGSGVDSVFGVALDSLGDVFLTSLNQGAILEVSGAGTQTTFASWLGGASALATDAAGDLYIANGASSVTEVPVGCASSTCDISLPGSYGFVNGLALDNAGDVYIADGNNGPLDEVQRSQPPALSFPSTKLNTTSSALTVAIQNIGNQPLTFASFAASTNFTVDSSATSCSTSAPLAPGGTCNMGVDFAPTTGGPLTGTLTLTDNTLNGSAATQTISLSGTGNVVTTSINVTTVSPSSEAYGQDAPVTITAVLSWTGSGTPPTASDVAIGGTGPGSYSATSCGTPVSDTLTCSATYTPGSADTVATYTESASFSGDSNYTGSSSTQTNNFSITQAGSSVSISASPNPSVVGEQVTFMATVSGEVIVAAQRNGAQVAGANKRGLNPRGQAHSLVTASGIGGTLTWSTNTGCGMTTVTAGMSSCSTSSLPAGTDAISASYSGDTNHTGSSGTLSGGQTVDQAPAFTSSASTTFTWDKPDSFPVTTSGYPAPNLWESGALPYGVSFTNNGNGTGMISGTPTGNGVYYIQLYANNNVGPTVVQNFTLIVDESPTFLSANSTTFVEGVSSSFTVTGCGYPTPTLTESGGLPAGVTLHISGDIATLSGTPTQTGVFHITFTVTSSLGSSTQSFTLTVAPPPLKLSSTSVNFGNVYLAAKPSAAITLTNPGTVSITLSSVAVTGAQKNDFSFANGCGSTLAGGGKCTITVNFDALAVGTASATLVLTDSAAGSPQNIGLTANVIDPIGQFSTGALAFSTVKVGSNQVKTVTFTNVGKTALAIGSIAITGADPKDFKQTNNCGSSLGAGASCTVTVTFAPTTTGNRSATLTATDNAQTSQQSVTLTGKGQ